jgi:hypothetical protein
MVRLAAKKLRRHPLSRVDFPDKRTVSEFAAMDEAREPLVDHVIGFMDGVSLPVECTDKQLEQNTVYCSYSCDTMVNNVLAFGPDGKVFLCALNFPGSWTDKKISHPFHSVH